MPLSSMTGFARATGADHGLSWQWELRSVNGKSLEVRLRLPPGYEHLESNVRTLISGAVKRGNIQAALSVDATTHEASVTINEVLLAQLVARAKKLQQELGSPPLQAESLLALRGVVEATQNHVDEDQRQHLDGEILASLSAALKNLVDMRNEEGQRLAKILHANIDTVGKLAARIRTNPARTVDAIRTRLKEQVQKLLEASGSLDPDRLHQEALLLATRNDVQEELDRLDSHVTAAQDLMQASEPVGRKFDFLSQEFNREANTICSKANDRSITALGLELKTVIDQLREQVQNIE
jgi:uncharacterized protein (TIGR00255 family)